MVARLVLHEVDNTNCVDGDNYFTLLSDGTMRVEWVGDYSQYDPADVHNLIVASLTRVGTIGATEPLVAVWAEPSINGDKLRPLLAAVTRTDALGQAAGVFLLRTSEPGNGCGGMWTSSQHTSGTNLTFIESFPFEQVGCTGAYSVTMQGTDGGAVYTRLGDAGVVGIPMMLQKLSR